MLGLACFNRFVVMPGLRVASTCDAQAGRLRISVTFELALGVLVLAAAAILGITPPPG
jgi:putative copper resistance protein D